MFHIISCFIFFSRIFILRISCCFILNISLMFIPSSLCVLV